MQPQIYVVELIGAGWENNPGRGSLLPRSETNFHGIDMLGSWGVYSKKSSIMSTSYIPYTSTIHALMLKRPPDLYLGIADALTQLLCCHQFPSRNWLATRRINYSALAWLYFPKAPLPANWVSPADAEGRWAAAAATTTATPTRTTTAATATATATATTTTATQGAISYAISAVSLLLVHVHRCLHPAKMEKVVCEKLAEWDKQKRTAQAEDSRYKSFLGLESKHESFLHIRK